MGKSEDNTSIKTKKGSPSKQEQTNVHLYPDWRTMQAYYGPGVPLPSPYFNSAVTAGHVPHPHAWASPQPLMPPYGLPYSTIYSQGVVYAHPAVPLVANPLSTGLRSKSSENTDQGSRKRLKTLDGLAMPVGNDSVEVDAEGSAHDASQSVGFDASSDGSDGNTGAHQSRRQSESMEHDGKVCAWACAIPVVEANLRSNRVSGIPLASENVAGNSVGSPNGKAETNAASAAAGLPFEGWGQDERQLKREKRKQANRESARRSRLRKQVETEELMERYESLKVENLTLISEINQLTGDSEKVRLENAALTEKLSSAQLGQPKKTSSR